MQMMRLFITILVAAITIAAVSCSKGGATADNGNGGGHINNPSDTIPPALIVNTPTDNQVFSNGNVITVSGRITDTEGLYRGSIRITNDANGSLVKEQLYEIHGVPLYNFSVSHAAVVSTASDYTVTVWFEDHGYNAASKSVKIKVNP